MKNIFNIALTIISLGVSACATDIPKSIPVGSWNYDLLINGVKMGQATISNTVQDKYYVYTFDLVMGNGATQSHDIIVETIKDCKPVRLEKHTYIQQGVEQKLDITAECNGKTITLTENNYKSTITLEEDFVFDGNYFLMKLIEKHFKKGTRINHNIYDPSLERERAIPVSITLQGSETISVNSVLYKAWKVEQNIGSIKNIVVYLDEQGVILKSSVSMLNLRLDIIRKD